MAYSSTTLPIEKGGIYHIYNHAVGEAVIFSKPYECERFLADIGKRLPRAADIFAWCLMKNHFHLMVKVTGEAKDFSNALGEALNAYAKWLNTRNERMGGLFVRPFKRKIAIDDRYIRWLLWYIHRNPLHHKATSNWEDYPWSSYQYYLNSTSAPGFLHTAYLIQQFGGLESLIAYHQTQSTIYIEDELI
jgi:REP element-mobilizing transposase RayT